MQPVIIVIIGDSDFTDHAVCGEVALNLVLRRDVNCNVTFDDSLTGERKSLFHRFGG